MPPRYDLGSAEHANDKTPRFAPNRPGIVPLASGFIVSRYLNQRALALATTPKPSSRDVIGVLVIETDTTEASI